jgi:hypothetical protein
VPAFGSASVRRQRALLAAVFAGLLASRPAAAGPLGGMDSETYRYGDATITRFIDDSWCGAYHCFAFGNARGGAYTAVSAPSPRATFAVGERPGGAVDLVDLASGQHQPYPDFAALVAAHPEAASAPPTILAKEPRGLLPTADTFFGARLLVTWLFSSLLFLATVAGYLASVWRRLTAARVATAGAIFLAETAALLGYLYFHW